MASREFENLIALASSPEAPPEALPPDDLINPVGSSRKAVISILSGGDAADVADSPDSELLLNPDVFDDLLAQAEQHLDDDRAMEQEIQRLAQAARELADLISHRRSSKRSGV